MQDSNICKENVKRWLTESEESQQNSSLSLHQYVPAARNEEMLQYPTVDEPQVSIQAASILSREDTQDDIKPNESVSNIGSKNSTERSVVSTASSARLKAEADLAALMQDRNY